MGRPVQPVEAEGREVRRIDLRVGLEVEDDARVNGPPKDGDDFLDDRVQVGFIGYGLIGAQHVFDFKNQKDVDLAAMCEVYQPRLEEGLAVENGPPGRKPD